MDVANITDIVVNNSVAIGVIVYFMYRDVKYIGSQREVLTQLKNCVEIIHDMLLKNKQED